MNKIEVFLMMVVVLGIAMLSSLEVKQYAFLVAIGLSVTAVFYFGVKILLMEDEKNV